MAALALLSFFVLFFFQNFVSFGINFVERKRKRCLFCLYLSLLRSQIIGLSYVLISSVPDRSVNIQRTRFSNDKEYLANVRDLERFERVGLHLVSISAVNFR